MCRSTSKNLNIQSKKRGFDPEIQAEVLKFNGRDNSTALPGKRDAKRVKKVRIQKRCLNDYLFNLYHKLKPEQPHSNPSFATFAKMRPANYVLANFVNRRSCLCTKHQNIALKLKMLRNLNKSVQANPDTFIKHFDSGDIQKLFDCCKVTTYDYEEWQKVEVNVKTRSGEEKNKEKNESSEKDENEN